MADCVVSQIVINKGSDRNFNVRIETDQGDPFDLTGVSQIEAIFQNDDGTDLVLTMTGGAVLPDFTSQGKIKIQMTSLQTTALKAADSASFELVITISGVKTVVQFVDKLQVIERLFPGT